MALDGVPGLGVDHRPHIGGELRRIAHGQLRRERRGHTLNTTALVHEAYLKLVDQRRVTWQNRAHFYGVASQAMRRILIDYARTRGRKKRGGNRERVPLDKVLGQVAVGPSTELLALNASLERLEAINARHGRVVECRYFGGLTIEETAAALNISAATVSRDWAMARAWLKRDLQAPPS